MKIFIIAIALVLSSCIGGGTKSKSKVGFAPETTQTQVDYHPIGIDELTKFSNGIKLSVMVPIDFTLANQELLQNKLLQVAIQGGVSGMGGTPTIVIAPLFALQSEGVTATAPAKNFVKYNLTIYIANVITGDVYSSSSHDIMGVGDSSELALQNAIESISANDPKLINMIQEAESRIVDYYAVNCSRIITQAQNAVNNNQYEVAVALLSSIPMDCGAEYDKAQEILAPIFKKSVEIRSEQALAQMKSCLSATTPESFAQAMIYYRQIPHDSATRAAADKLYNDTKATLDKAEQDRIENQREQANRESETARELAIMQLQINSEAKDELMGKYKKDAAYNKLPWLRKLVHMGDLDPFDGTSNTRLDSKIDNL